MKNLALNKWINYTFKINNYIINKSSINLALSTFYKEKIINLAKKQVIKIIFKVRYTHGKIRSISFSTEIQKLDLKYLLDIFYNDWVDKSDEYNQDMWKNIIFTYKILSLETKINKIKLTNLKDKNSNKINKFKFYGINLPSTMDFTSWGKILVEEYRDNDMRVIISKPNSKTDYWIYVNDTYMCVDLRMNYGEKKIILSFKDTLNDKYNLNTFTRLIRNQEYKFVEGELKLKILKRKTNILGKISQNWFLSNKFITMDL